ncbi:MAG: four helix bundle protein [candidate division WOR-3 bacterium]
MRRVVEGAARDSSKEFAHFVDIAIGSCEEVRYQLLLSKDLGYITEVRYRKLAADYEKVKMMLSKLLTKIK